MGILIIGILLLIAGIILGICRMKKSLDYFDGWSCSALIMATIGIAILIVCFLLFISVNKDKQSKYEAMALKREILICQLNENNIYKTDEDILADILDFNETVRQSKKYKDDFWAGIFYNDLYAELDYIKIVPIAVYVEAENDWL